MAKGSAQTYSDRYSEAMKHPNVTSQKQHIRLWFEFYKLALADPDLQDNLAKVRTFYEPWGDPRGIEFREWWKSHSYLFGSTEVEEVTKAINAPNVITIAIPLNQPVSKTLPSVKALIKARHEQRLKQLGLDNSRKKPLKAAFGQYEINAKELRGRTLYVALLLYQVWLEHGKPAIGSKFLQIARDWFQNRPRANWIPLIITAEAVPDGRGKPQFTDEQIRNVRRSITKAQDVCKAVSKGRFPI